MLLKKGRKTTNYVQKTKLGLTRHVKVRAAPMAITVTRTTDQLTQPKFGERY